MERDRNLLFGIFAVQIKGVTPHQIVEAGAAWAVDPSISLANRLVQQGALLRRDADFVNQLVDVAITAHHGDATQALEALGGESQVDKTFHGSIVRKPSGGVDTRPMVFDAIFGDPAMLLSTAEETPGRYSHISEYGRGGMGRVLLVHDEHMGRDVALKELLPDSEGETRGMDSPVRYMTQFAARFLQEGRITAQLEHPSIVPVYELGRRNNGTLYYTMKLVRGQTLSKAFKACTCLADRLALLSNFVDICHAIAYAHSRGVIHRDIKPANVMVGAFGETVVLDWGLAKGREVTPDSERTFDTSIRSVRLKEKQRPEVTPFETRAGEAIGTPNYMSPEQAEGRGNEINEKSDIYSLGVVLYELLAGEVPFDGSTIEQIVYRVLNETAPDIAKIEPGAPPELIEVCKKAMHKDPAQRYASASELAAEVTRFMTGSLVQAYQYTPAQILRRTYKRHRLAVNTGALALVALLALGVFSYVNILNARNNERAQRVIAEQARKTEAEARAEAESQAYVAQLRLAQSYIDDQQMPLADDALEKAPVALRDWVWGYLKNQANQALFKVHSEKSVIFWAKYDPTGKFIVALRNPEPPGMWDAETGTHIRDFEGDEAIYNSAAFNDDGTRFAAIGEIGLDVWDTTTGKHLYRLQHPNLGYDVTFPPGTSEVWGSYDDGQLVAWDLASGTAVRTLDTAAGPVGALRIAGSVLLAASNSGQVQGWDLASGTRRYTVAGTGVWPSPDGKTFVAAMDKTPRLYDTSDGTERRAFEGHEDGILDVSFSKDGHQLVTASRDRTVRLWSVDTSESQRIFPMHGNTPVFVYFIDNGRQILGCGGSNRYCVWDAQTGAVIHEFSGNNFAVAYAQIHPQQDLLLSSSAFHNFEVFDIQHPKSFETLFVDAEHAPQNTMRGQAQFSSMGGCLAWQFSDAINVYSVPQDKMTARFAIPPRTATRFALAASGMRLVYFTGKTLLVANTANGEEVRRVDLEFSPTSGLALNADGTTVAVGDRNGQVRILSVSSGAQLQTFTLPSEAHTLDFSPQGALLGAGCSDGRVYVLNLDTGEVLYQWEASTAPILGVTMHASETLLATVARDGTVVVWNYATKAQQARFSMEEAFLTREDSGTSVYFSADGQYLISRGNFYPLSVIDIKRGDIVLRIPNLAYLFLPSDRMKALTLSQDGVIRAMDWGT